ncbi:hypothetical protein BKA70DRAFT_1290058, partial [Coprinopsis sp. MPI-PUGE-AT-0042]
MHIIPISIGVCYSDWHPADRSSTVFRSFAAIPQHSTCTFLNQYKAEFQDQVRAWRKDLPKSIYLSPDSVGFVFYSTKLATVLFEAALPHLDCSSSVGMENASSGKETLLDIGGWIFFMFSVGLEGGIKFKTHAMYPVFIARTRRLLELHVELLLLFHCRVMASGALRYPGPGPLNATGEKFNLLIETLDIAQA